MGKGKIPHYSIQCVLMFIVNLRKSEMSLEEKKSVLRLWLLSTALALEDTGSNPGHEK